jgi:hypothetical protein
LEYVMSFSFVVYYESEREKQDTEWQAASQHADHTPGENGWQKSKIVARKTLPRKQEAAARADRTSRAADDDRISSAKINGLTRQVAEFNDLNQEMRAALRRLEAEQEILARR